MPWMRSKGAMGKAKLETASFPSFSQLKGEVITKVITTPKGEVSHLKGFSLTPNKIHSF